MTNRLIDANGSLKPKPKLLLDVRQLPCPELEDKAARMVKAGTFDAVEPLHALQISVALALEGLLDRLNHRGTFLFFGPTGSGKTTLAYILPQIWATQARGRAQLVRVNAHVVAATEHGQSQKNVSRLFEELGALCASGDPVFAVIDEVETVATERTEISGKTSPIDARASVNCLLDQIDHKPRNLFIIGTTNVVGLIDKALLSQQMSHSDNHRHWRTPKMLPEVSGLALSH